MKLLSFIIAAGLLAGCNRSEPAAAAADIPAVAVKGAPVTAASRSQTRIVAGIVRPHDRATVAARVMGTIGTARLAVGLQVKAGEVLVQINAGELGAQLELARAALAQAERDHARETALAEKGAAAEESVRLATDQLRMARARLTEAEAVVAYLQVTAPFTGVITEDLINAGDFAAPGQPLFTVEGQENLLAEMPVPESLATLDIGTPIAVQLDGQTLDGTLAELSPSADPTSRTRLAKIALPADSGARSGQFVRAFWPAGTENILTVPSNAVQSFGQMERVFVIEENRARLRLVRTGTTSGDDVQILSGLNAGETVVTSPPATLRDGQPLRLTP